MSEARLGGISGRNLTTGMWSVRAVSACGVAPALVRVDAP
jgi:hypothetical protein